MALMVGGNGQNANFAAGGGVATPPELTNMTLNHYWWIKHDLLHANRVDSYRGAAAINK